MGTDFDTVVILDFGSQYTQLIARKTRELGTYSEIHPYNISINQQCRDLLNIILSNLLSNAIRYSPAQTSVTVNAERENDEIHIMVKDEGIGIKPDEIDRIFEEFYIH